MSSSCPHPLLLVLEIYHSNPGKHACPHQVDIQHKSGLFLFHCLDRQLRVEPFALLNYACACQCVINTTVLLQRSLEKRDVVPVFGDVCTEESDRRRIREGGKEVFGGIGVEVTDYGGARFAEETDGRGSNAVGAA